MREGRSEIFEERGLEEGIMGRGGSWSTRTEVEEEEVAGGGRWMYKTKSGDSRFQASPENRLLRQSTFSLRFRIFSIKRDYRTDACW